MNIEDIKFIYEYNYWANAKILEAASRVTEEQFLAPAEYPFGGLRGTLLHIVDGERLWRVLLETGKVTEDEDLIPEDFPTFESLQNKFNEEEKLLLTYLDRLTDEDMDKHLTYPVGEGVIRDRIFWHCFYHLANHGIQHRSEAAALLTRYNASPGDLDFLHRFFEPGSKG